MLKNVSRAKLVASWFAAIVVLFALSVVMGANISVGATELWLLACFAPPKFARPKAYAFACRS